MPDRDHAGDVTAKSAWETLQADPSAVLIDVRTKVEWQLIGRPDLATIGKEPIFLQWVKTGGVNENFTEELRTALAECNVSKNTPLFFMCQSGGRSKIAATQCAELGYEACYNVADGFEGDLDEHKHRNSINGWKATGLPWTQS